MGRLILLLVLILSLAGATYILLDLRSDGPLAITFCFGLPALFVAVAVIMGTLFDGAVMFGRREVPIVLGRCRHCGTTFHMGEGHCVVCGMATGFWAQNDRMRTKHADDRSTREVENTNPPDLAPHSAAKAAEVLVLEAGIHEIEQLDTIEACLTDASLTRQLYIRAALRLHPDNNEGVHRREWFALQGAIAVLNRHHQM